MKCWNQVCDGIENIRSLILFWDFLCIQTLPALHSITDHQAQLNTHRYTDRYSQLWVCVCSLLNAVGQLLWCGAAPLWAEWMTITLQHTHRSALFYLSKYPVCCAGRMSRYTAGYCLNSGSKCFAIHKLFYSVWKELICSFITIWVTVWIDLTHWCLLNDIQVWRSLFESSLHQELSQLLTGKMDVCTPLYLVKCIDRAVHPSLLCIMKSLLCRYSGATSHFNVGKLRGLLVMKFMSDSH